MKKFNLFKLLILTSKHKNYHKYNFLKFTSVYNIKYIIYITQKKKNCYNKIKIFLTFIKYEFILLINTTIQSLFNNNININEL